jgi:hypothetical protein
VATAPLVFLPLPGEGLVDDHKPPPLPHRQSRALWAQAEGGGTLSKLRHHPRHPILAHMRVDLRRRQVHVPKQRLDVHELGAGFEEAGCIGMPELMRRDLLVEARAIE